MLEEDYLERLQRRSAEIVRLRAEIEAAEWPYWLHPAVPPVMGFDGYGPVMLIAYRPIILKTPNHTGVQRLYSAIQDLGIGFDCHITDCIKSPSSVRLDQEIQRRELDWNLKILHEEIRAVRPPFLIVLGTKAYRFLRRHQVAADLELRNMGHYSDRFETCDEDGLDPFARRLAANLNLLRETPEWREWESMKRDQEMSRE